MAKNFPTVFCLQNFCSRAAIQAMGSCLNNKYSEGYPGARYDILLFIMNYVLTLQAPNLQNGQTHSNNSPGNC